MNNQILQSAIQYLSRREHSVKELQNKLLNKGFEIEEINTVITQLQENHYQSDKKTADFIFRHRLNKGYGIRYIEQELKLKGISSSDITELLRNQQIDWFHQAELAYNKRYANKPIIDIKDKAKRVRFLQSRGFANDEIFALFNH